MPSNFARLQGHTYEIDLIPSSYAADRKQFSSGRPNMPILQWPSHIFLSVNCRESRIDLYNKARDGGQYV